MNFRNLRTKLIACIIIINFVNYSLCYQSTSNKLVFRDIFVSSANISSTKFFEGYNLFVLETCDLDDWKLNKSLIIADMEGNIYFQKVIGTGMSGLHVPSKFVNSTTILYADTEGVKLWNFETDVVKSLNFTSHHDVEKNYASNTYFALSQYAKLEEGFNYLYDTVNEYTIPRTQIWHYNTGQLVSADQWCIFEEMTGSLRDLTHTNTIFYDEDDDSLYLHMRNVNSIYKIDHQTKSLIWSLGEYSDFAQYDINGRPKDILFYHAHALEKVNNNTFMIFDNDQHNQTNASDQASRLLEITINEDTMTANITWEWIAPNEYFSKIWGDCDLMPNGNIMGVFGTHSHPLSLYSARLVEVNRRGEIVWEMAFPRTLNETFGIYQADRFRFAPIVSQPKLTKNGDQDIVEWDVWYNYRAKVDFVGKYYITIDGELVKTDQISLPKYWQSTKVSYEVNPSDNEISEITLIVEDEAGHLSNDTDKYSSIGTLNLKSIKIAIILNAIFGGTIILVILLSITLRYLKKK